VVSDQVALTFRRVGEHALFVEVANPWEAQAIYAVVRDAVSSGSMPAPRDVVPAARTVLLDGVRPDAWRVFLSAPEIRAGAAPVGKEVRVPVRYDGPDLGEVAAAWGCDARDVPRLHQATSYVVAFCGFAPGFAYCLGDQPRHPVPRRADPRTRIPAGSVGLAGEYCGIYPGEMPGGWQVVGTTDLVLFDAEREQPALLEPGDRVLFEVAS
jgi:KipI family sensor histidine kinase inhibitor